MRCSTAVTAVCLATLLTVCVSVDAADKFKPAPGCKKRYSELAELEASLKGERKVPYDRGGKLLKECNLLNPIPPREIRNQVNVAVIVFDVTGSGRVVGQQLVAGKGTPWGEPSVLHVAQWLFEPLVEDGVGITRVGVTVALIAGPMAECHKLPPTAGADFEVRMCSRV